MSSPAGGGGGEEKKPAKGRKRSAAALAGEAQAQQPPAPAGPFKPPRRAMLDTSRSNQKLWLVKVPIAVAEAIKAAQAGAKVGTLTVSKTTGPGGELRTDSVRLEEALCDERELPRDYTLEAPPQGSKMPRMYAIRCPEIDATKAGAPAGKGMVDSLRVEGLVARRTSLLPTASIDYRAFAKKRLIQAHKKDRRLTVINTLAPPGRSKGADDRSKDINFDDLPTPMPGSAGGRPAVPKGKLDATQLRTELFRLFEQKESWSLKEIKTRLGPQQTDSAVKQALSAIADYQPQGQYRGQYLLKMGLGGKRPAAAAAAAPSPQR